LKSLIALGLAGCAGPTQGPDFGGDPEAERIFNDLASSGFIPREIPNSDNTALAPAQTEIVSTLRALSAAPEGTPERAAAREKVSTALSATAMQSAVCFRTPKPGATVKVKSLSANRPLVAVTTNGDASYPMVLGIYHIWTERNSMATTPRDNRFDITTRRRRIDLEGDSASIKDCNAD